MTQSRLLLTPDQPEALALAPLALGSWQLVVAACPWRVRPHAVDAFVDNTARALAAPGGPVLLLSLLGAQQGHGPLPFQLARRLEALVVDCGRPYTTLRAAPLARTLRAECPRVAGRSVHPASGALPVPSPKGLRDAVAGALTAGPSHTVQRLLSPPWVGLSAVVGPAVVAPSWATLLSRRLAVLRAWAQVAALLAATRPSSGAARADSPRPRRQTA